MIKRSAYRSGVQNQMRFYLNGTERELPDDSADLTLLNVLRAHPTLKGTKKAAHRGIAAPVPCWWVDRCQPGLALSGSEQLPAFDGSTRRSLSNHRRGAARIKRRDSASCPAGVDRLSRFAMRVLHPGIVMSMSALYEETGALLLRMSKFGLRWRQPVSMHGISAYSGCRSTHEGLRAPSSPVSLWHPEQNPNPASPSRR